MSNAPSREEIDAKLQAVEARIDAKLIGIDAKIDIMKIELLRHIEALPSRRDLFGFYSTVIVIALAVVAAIFAAVSMTEARYVGFLERIPVSIQTQPGK